MNLFKIGVAFLLVVGVTAVLGFGFLETGLRLKAKWQASAAEGSTPDGVERSLASGRSEFDAPIFEQHPFLIVYNKKNMRDGSVNTNSRGFRGTREYSVAKPAGIKRILFIGGSAAVGFKASGDSKAIPAQLESLLNASAKKPMWEVINAACAGFNSVQDLILLSTELLAYQPDLVIAYGGGTDLNTSMSPRWHPNYHEMQEALFAKSFHPVYEHSQAYQFFQQLFPKPTQATEGVFHPQAVETYEANVKRMAAVTVGAGARFVSVLQPALEISSKPKVGHEAGLVAATVAKGGLPTNYAALVKQLYDVAVPRLSKISLPQGAYFLDHSDVFAATKDEVFADAFHLNDRGYALEAERLSRFLASAKIY